LSLESALASRNGLLTTFGKSILNIKYPKEFELYIIALELVDEDFNTKKYFIFPVNPSSIDEGKPQLTNVKKTLSGVTVLKSATFVPTDINLSGTFGRGFKITLGETSEDFIQAFTINGNIQEFDPRIKTGYGCLKILEEIVEQSKAISGSGTNFKLIFHNPAFGNSYLVEPMNFRINMNEQNNMFHGYSLTLKSIARIDSLFDAKKLQSIARQLAVNGFIQKQVGQLLNNVSGVLGTAANKIPQTKI